MNATARRPGMTGTSYTGASGLDSSTTSTARRDIPWPDPEGAVEVTAERFSSSAQPGAAR